VDGHMDQPGTPSVGTHFLTTRGIGAANGRALLHQRREEHLTRSDKVQPFTWLVLAGNTTAHR